VAFIGDDAHDVELLRAVGLAACPADAVPAARAAAVLHCRAAGGHGAFRELADAILAGR
jgi:3-deoxy-D-manno-octulosonate 8-phosphate phosphatase (KDO 8-P phosphatase)